MIELKEEDEECYVLIADKVIDILDISNDSIFATCIFGDLRGVVANSFSEKLTIEVRSENRFGTYFFHELRISCNSNELALDFVCHTPNKYWEGKFGLAIFLDSVRKQVSHSDNFKVIQIELEDDWKGITIRHLLPLGDLIEAAILNAATELKKLLSAAEIALGGIEWKIEYSIKEDLFCKELLLPLLRRMGFVFVRYTHGKKNMVKILHSLKLLLLEITGTMAYKLKLEMLVVG